MGGGGGGAEHRAAEVREVARRAQPVRVLGGGPGRGGKQGGARAVGAGPRWEGGEGGGVGGGARGEGERRVERERESVSIDGSWRVLTGRPPGCPAAARGRYPGETRG